MKKIYFYLFMLVPLLSCVDNDYDLSDIDDDNNQIGESFVVPIAKLNVKGDELFDFGNVGTDGKVEIDETFYKTYKIESGLGEDVTDWIGDNDDEIIMIAKVTNKLPPNVRLKMNIKLLDENGNELTVNGESLMSNMDIISGEEGMLSYNINSDVIENLNKASDIKVDFEQLNVPKIENLVIDPADLFKIKLSLKKDGGLSF